MWNYIILLVVVVVFVLLWVRQRVEFFQGQGEEETTLPGYNATFDYGNKGPEVWQRHPVQTSVLADMNFKFKKAYNYELENEAYVNGLKKTFAIRHNCINPQDFGVVEPVNRVTPANVLEAYQSALVYVRDRVRNSEFLKLPDDQPVFVTPIQVVHDKLVSYQRHKLIPSIILNMEAVLYREGKYHAKHVGLTVQANKNKGMWEIVVLDVWINGVVFEDQIGLFPVTANDPLNTNQDLSTPQFPQPRFSRFDDDVQFYEYCSSTNLDENKQKACIEVIQNTPPKTRLP
jgi:hypothetical protein